MTIAANVFLSFGIIETITGDDIASTQVPHTAFDLVGLTLPTATNPTTQWSGQTYALVAGTKTIDLTALEVLGNAALDTTGLKIQAIVLINPMSNGNLTISGEGTNGRSLGSAHTLFGSASRDTRLILDVPETGVDADATHKLLVVTGTGTQSFSLGILLG